VEPKRRSCPGENTRRATASLTGVRFLQDLLLCGDARVDECELWGYRCQLRGCRSGSSQLTVSNETYCCVPDCLGVRSSGCSAQDRLRVAACRCVSLPDSCEVPIGTVAWAITIPTGDLFISIAYQPLILPQSALPTLHLLQLSSLFTTFLAQHDISYVLAFSDNSALAVRYPCQP
jgi:hypothetical protein